jgi:DNA polymerase III epsilon subunit-like protein
VYLFFDTETTGLPLRWDADFSDLDNWPRLVQLGFLACDGKGKLQESADLIIRPEGFTIPKDAERIHKISTERALRDGISLSDALGRFADALDEASVLVAHNMDFDNKVVAAELFRKGMHSDLETLKEVEKFCTMKSATGFCAIPKGGVGNEYKWPSLSELHWKLFAREFVDAHDAYKDAEACARCFFRLLELKQKR